MRVVVDTNVVVSALLTPHGPASVVVGLALARAIQPLTDGRMSDEYEDVLRRSEFGFSPADVVAFLDRWSQVAKPVTAAPIPGGLTGMPDPDDAVFLEVAYSGRADALITSNLRHYPERFRHGIAVVTPMVFVTTYLRPAQPGPSMRTRPRPRP